MFFPLLLLKFTVGVIIQDAKTEGFLRVSDNKVFLTKDEKDATKIEIEFLPGSNDNVLLKTSVKGEPPLYLDYFHYSNFLTPYKRSEHINQRFTLTMNSSNNYDIVNNDTKFLYVDNDWILRGGIKPADSLGFHILSDDGKTNYYDDLKSKQDFLGSMTNLQDGGIFNINSADKSMLGKNVYDSTPKKYADMMQNNIKTPCNIIMPTQFVMNPLTQNKQ